MQLREGIWSWLPVHAWLRDRWRRGADLLAGGHGLADVRPCCLLCNIRYCYGCRDNGFVKTRYGLCGHAQHFLLVLLC